MKLIVWIFRIVLFLLLLAFAIKNDSVVAVRVFFGSEWMVPLIVVMLVMFAGGVLLGATATVATLFSQRREIRRLRRASVTESTTNRPRTVSADIPEAF
ncbi:lipopolysaccharide assembly protein LapA domain-containing protein [Uliginosibacterium sp. sgz301328]|uniref:lipopolysaccharide assembly protein LapA domain-containing protein n=1 Tax=Uliginosibacterium sp. sgz301328 TaxID=3243764 RepID=UPI00359E4A66